MLVSIIVPNYNHRNFLIQRIESILNQTYQNIEIILLDDCSTDGSRSIVEQFRNHPKVRHIVYNEQNSGSPFRQWEKGVSLAKGEWIWIAESDDYAHPTLLEFLVAGTQRHAKIVLSYGQSMEVDRGGNVLRSMLWWVRDLDPNRWTADYVNDGVNEIETCLLYKNSIPNASAVLFKKAAYLKVDKAYTGMKKCGDWMAWIQMLKEGKVSYIAEPLNFFRQHSATTRIIDTREKLRSRLEEEYAIWQYIKENIPGVKPQSLLKRLNQLIGLYRESYTGARLMRFLCFPFLYQGRFPLRWLVADYLKCKVKRFRNKRTMNNLPAEA